MPLDGSTCRNNGHRRASRKDTQKSQSQAGEAPDSGEGQQHQDALAPDLSRDSPASSSQSCPAVPGSSIEADSASARDATVGQEEAEGSSPKAGLAPKKKPWSAGTLQARAEEAVKRGPKAAELKWLEPESDEGNVEYKLRLKDPSTMRFQQLVSGKLSYGEAKDVVLKPVTMIKYESLSCSCLIRYCALHKSCSGCCR